MRMFEFISVLLYLMSYSFDFAHRKTRPGLMFTTRVGSLSHCTPTGAIERELMLMV